MKARNIQYITRTAILLALALLFQMMRLFIPGIPQQASQYLIGTLVNTCLYIAAMNVGFWSGLAISILTPVIAAIQGFLPFPILVPFVAIGNALLVVLQVLITKRLKKQWGYFIAAACASTAKFVFLLLTVSAGAAGFLGIPAAAASVISLDFSYPQIITAVLGAIVAMPIIFALQRIDTSHEKPDA